MSEIEYPWPIENSGLSTKGHSHLEADITDLDDYLTDAPIDNEQYARKNGAWSIVEAGEGGGVSDHGALTGLADDDHTQYHTDARGDARYYTKAQVDASLTSKADDAHAHLLEDITGAGGAAALEVGTTAGTVAAGDHTHSGYAATSHTHAVADLTDGASLATDAEVTAAVSAHQSGSPHVALTSTAPTAVTAATGAVGTATDAARRDHRHQVTVGTPTSLGAANAAGSSTSLARADHVHAYPTAAQVGAAATSHTHVKADITDFGTYATTAQGALADSAVQPGDDAATLGSGVALDGAVLTADGTGGAAWEPPVNAVEAGVFGWTDSGFPTAGDTSGWSVHSSTTDITGASPSVSVYTDGARDVVRIQHSGFTSTIGTNTLKVRCTAPALPDISEMVNYKRAILKRMVTGYMTGGTFGYPNVSFRVTDAADSTIANFASITAQLYPTGNDADYTAGLNISAAAKPAGAAWPATPLLEFEVTYIFGVGLTAPALDLRLELPTYEFLKGITDVTDLASGTATDGHVLTADGLGGMAWEAAAGGGTSDHGALTGLGDDDHTQYALADGSRGSFATTAQGALAATAVQPADLLPVEGGEARVNTVAASGATETLPAEYAVHKVTMDQNCTFTFPTPTADGAAFRLDLSGAFTPTFPASVDWPDATPPTYASPSSYAFSTNDGGTTWLGTFIGGAFG